VAPGGAELRREPEFKFLVTAKLIGGLNVGVTDHVSTNLLGWDSISVGIQPQL